MVLWRHAASLVRQPIRQTGDGDFVVGGLPGKVFISDVAVLPSGQHLMFIRSRSE